MMREQTWSRFTFYHDSFQKAKFFLNVRFENLVAFPLREFQRSSEICLCFQNVPYFNLCTSAFIVGFGVVGF